MGKGMGMGMGMGSKQVLPMVRSPNGETGEVQSEGTRPFDMQCVPDLGRRVR